MDGAAELRRGLDSDCVAEAEILRMDGTVRTSTAGFLTTVQEGRRLVGLFEAPADALADGISVGGERYVAAEASRHLLHGKRGGRGVVAVRRPPFVVVGLYRDGQQSGDALLAVDQLAALLAAASH
ncbi:profilin [Streptomyces sp. 12297]